MPDQKRKAPYGLADHYMAFTDRFWRQWDQWWTNRPSLAKPATPEQVQEMLRHAEWAPPETVPFALHQGREGFRHRDFPGHLFLFKLEGATRAEPVGCVTAVGILQDRRVDPAKARHLGQPPPQFLMPPDDLAPMERWNWWVRRREEIRGWLAAHAARGPASPGSPHEAAVREALRRTADRMRVEEDGDAARLAEEAVAQRAEIDELKDAVRRLARRVESLEAASSGE